MRLSNLKLYRRLCGGKWIKIDGCWHRCNNEPGTVFHDFAQTPDSHVHYSYMGIEQRENYTKEKGYADR